MVGKRVVWGPSLVALGEKSGGAVAVLPLMGRADVGMEVGLEQPLIIQASCSYTTRISEMKKGKEKGEEEPVLVRSFIASLDGGRRQLSARSRLMSIICTSD